MTEDDDKTIEFPVPSQINAQLVLPDTDDDKKGLRLLAFMRGLTQAVIALGVTGAVIYAALKDIKSESLVPAFVLIMTLYFGGRKAESSK